MRALVTQMRLQLCASEALMGLAVLEVLLRFEHFGNTRVFLFKHPVQPKCLPHAGALSLLPALTELLG